MIGYTLGHEAPTLPTPPVRPSRLPADADGAPAHRHALAGIPLLDALAASSVSLPLLRRAANALDRRRVKHHTRKAAKANKRGDPVAALGHARAGMAAHRRVMERTFGKPGKRGR